MSNIQKALYLYFVLQKLDNTMKIAKEYRWEMGHRLTFHTGGCASLHGHSYKVWIELEGNPNKNGMLLDYFEMDKIVFPLLKQLDHSFAVYEKDIELIEFLTKIQSKMNIFPFHPTAENLCIIFLEKLEQAGFPKNINNIKVRLSETEDVYAEETKNL